MTNPKSTSAAAEQVAAQAKQAFAQAVAWHQQGQLAQAQALYQQVLRLQPGHFDALHLLGVIAAQSGSPAHAVALIGQAIAINTNNADAHYNLGVALRDLKRHQDAVASYDRAIALRPDYADAYYNRGNALQDLRQYQAAVASYDRAIALQPDHADFYSSRGNALWQLKQYQAALHNCDRAIALMPDHADAYNNRGNVLRDMQQYQAALQSYDRAIALNPAYADAHNNRGSVLRDLRQYQAALQSYDRAIALNPAYADAHNNRGVVLQNLRQFQAAIASHDRAIALRPDHAEAYLNHGNALHNMRQHEAALQSYDRAIALNPDLAEAHNNRGYTLYDLKQYQAAVTSLDRAAALSPDYNYLPGMRLHSRMQICDWHDFVDQCRKLADQVALGAKACNPFPFLAISNSPSLQRKAAEIWVRDKFPPSAALPALEKNPKHDKIRVGYFSADFREHAVSLLTAELFETHDRSRFELTAFSFGPDSGDAVRKRVMAAFDKFIDVRDQSDQDVALLARKLEIDIAVDLGGFTTNSRSGILALRAAPLQVGYLGYLGTLGAEYMDYLVADPVLIPENEQQHYAEQIVYLPSYQANDSRRSISERPYTRAELGLPQTGFVFCCFNNSYKITPGTFAAWMRILKRVENSVIWLLEDNPTATDNLRSAAISHGVDDSRLVFGKRLPIPEYLARYRMADLFLDTQPYNAGTTGSDALWAGLPVLTCAGATFAGRMAASLLTAIHLPELITTTLEEYEALAVTLATHPAGLAELRGKLAHNRLSAPLFDTPLFTRHLEAAYTEMYRRYRADLPPAHIRVQA